MSANETNTNNLMKWVPHAIYSRKSSLDAGGFAEESGIVGALLGRSAADRVQKSGTRVSQAVSASCHCNQNFCPPSGSDTHLQIRRAPRSAATWVDVIVCRLRPSISVLYIIILELSNCMYLICDIDVRLKSILWHDL